MKSNRLSAGLLACMLLLATAAAPALAGQTLLHNARIHTADPDQPLAEAMVWGADGRLLAVGGTGALLARWPDARRIDAGGEAVVPGLIDAHAHLMNLGIALMTADLSGADSKAEVLRRLQAFEATLGPDDWLLGRGWDQNRWPERDFPTAADLDTAFPDRPVLLRRVDGHADWANTAAMQATGRDFDGDWQPEGRRILRDDAGRATGVFIDARDLLEDAVPPQGRAWREEAFERALAEAVRLGITGVHDMGVSVSDLAIYRAFADAGRLPLRVTAYADGDREALQALCAFGHLQHPSLRLQMRGVKLYGDGALGSRGAALIEDYSDDPGNRGLMVTAPDALESAMRTALACDVQVAAHAIGDRANRVMLERMRRVLGERADGDHRWRIEHAQIVAVEDIPRFATLGLIASMQPTHATSDMPWAGDRVGPRRLAGAYAWRSFLDAGVPLALGSDFPVEAVDPRLGLYAAVTRQDADGQPPGGWLPGQRLSLAEALAGFTAEAARAGFAEDVTGRLAEGMAADFVVLGADPAQVPAADLLRLPVRSTWVDGQPVFQAP